MFHENEYIQWPRSRSLTVQATAMGLQFTENVSEKSRFRVEAQHIARETLDDEEASVPKSVAI